MLAGVPLPCRLAPVGTVGTPDLAEFQALGQKGDFLRRNDSCLRACRSSVMQERQTSSRIRSMHAACSSLSVTRQSSEPHPESTHTITQGPIKRSERLSGVESSEFHTARESNTFVILGSQLSLATLADAAEHQHTHTFPTSGFSRKYSYLASDHHHSGLTSSYTYTSTVLGDTSSHLAFPILTAKHLQTSQSNHLRRDPHDVLAQHAHHNVHSDARVGISTRLRCVLDTPVGQSSPTRRHHRATPRLGRL